MPRVPLTMGAWNDGNNSINSYNHNSSGSNRQLNRVTKSRHSAGVVPASEVEHHQQQRYQSLQYSQEGLKKTSGKYSRDGRDETLNDGDKIPDHLKALGNNGKYNNGKVISGAAKPFKRPSLSQMTLNNNNNSHNSSLHSGSNPSVDVVAASKNPSATSNGLSSEKQEQKPQFYFGQPLRPTVTNSHHTNHGEQQQQPQSAIDKVKNNEAVSHPKNIVINPGYRLKDYIEPSQKSGGKPVFAFGDRPPPKPAVPMKSAAVTAALSVQRSKSPASTSTKQKQEELEPEPMIKPVVMNYSKFSIPAPAGDADFRVPRPKNNYEITHKRSSLPVKEQTTAEVNRAFEAELLAGKSKLKGYSSSSGTGNNNHYSAEDNDSGSSGSGPSMILPPPPPPPQFGNVINVSSAPLPPPPPPVISAPIPAAPKLPSSSSSTASMTASGKRIMPAKKGPTVNPRDELMAAIRDSAGGARLRKVKIFSM